MLLHACKTFEAQAAKLFLTTDSSYSCELFFGCIAITA